MAGLSGRINSLGTSAPDREVAVMVERMCHESSMRLGEVAFPLLKAAAGWVSRPGSFSDCLPIWNEKKTVCLLFNGEEFSIADQLMELRRKGHDLLEDNASGLVHLYEEIGSGFFARLNGWFSGLIVDLRNETCTLFNDRFGLSRIYYHEARFGFYFASEAKSILAVLPELRRIDERGLAEFVSIGCVLQNRSLFHGISLLPGGSFWTFHRDGQIEKRKYFNPEIWENQEALTPAAYGDRLREVFSRVAPRYLQGPEQVAISLTGGLDSRMILAWAGAKPGTLPCYTFGGPYRDCADLRIARKLARICSQPHTTIPIGEDFFRDFESLAEKTVYLTDGVMDVSGSVELHVNRLAREIAPVRLTGNYGSEILRSNVAFGPRLHDGALFTPEFLLLLQEAALTYKSEAVGHPLSFIAFKQVPWHHYARLALEQSQLTCRSPFLDNELVALAYQAPPELAKSPQPLLRLIADGNPALDAVETDRSLRRNSRSLFSGLAKGWQEFTAKAEYAYDYGMPDRLARFDGAFKSFHFERLFLGRHKFYHFRIWYRDQLRAEVKELALNSTVPIPCYRAGSVQRIVEDHLSARRNLTLSLHKLISIQLIYKLFASHL